MKKILSLVLLVSLVTFSSQSIAGTAKGMDTKEIEKIVEQFILEHPEVIIQSMENMQKRQRELQQKQAKVVLEQKYDAIAHNPADPIAGNPKGDVTVVEFFDYNCGYCKYVLKHVQEVLETDKNVKFVFKELPILGEGSIKAAQAAIAVNLIAPEKYFEYHTAVMNMPGTKNEASLLKVVKGLGIDEAKFKDALKDAKIGQILAENRQLAGALGVNGTPGFVVGKELVPGAVSAKEMKDKIEALRKQK